MNCPPRVSHLTRRRFIENLNLSKDCFRQGSGGVFLQHPFDPFASTFLLSFCSSFLNKNRKRDEKRANYCIVSVLLIHRLLIFTRATRERRRSPLAVRRRLMAHRRVLKVLRQRSRVERRQCVRARDSRGRRDHPSTAQRRRRPARVQVTTVD